MTGRHLAATVLTAAALLSAAACAGQAALSAAGATRGTPHSTTPPTTATPATPTRLGSSMQGTPIVPPPTSSPAAGTEAATAAPCGNGDIRVGWGHGSVGGPHQGSGVVFTNVSHHTCTLRGYPGAAIAGGLTVINAGRVLNGYLGDRRIGLSRLGSPPLVTLTPGAFGSAMLEWMLRDGQACYPAMSGTIEITPPGTMDTVAVSHGAVVGTQGICSSLEINPVVAGTIG